MELPKSLKKLCSPALVYFIISMIGFVLLLLQNIGNSTKYHIGSFSTNVSSTILIFVLKFIYIIFWTWILNLLCKGGFSIISWLFILFPILLFFVVLGLLIIH
jgi:uncharacterized membrane protein